MEWTVLVSLITSSIQICYSARTQEASYFCEKQDNNLVAKFRLVRNNDTIYQIIGHTAAEPDPDQSSPVTSCADISTDSQKDIYYLNVTIDLQTSTSYPTCGVYTIETGKKYKLRIRSQTTVGIKSVEDAYYDFICDVQKSLASWVRATTLGLGSLTETNLQPFQSSLSFWLMDYTTNIPLFGEVELGREMYYQIGFQSCFKQDTQYDTCGHEFWVAFQSLGIPSDSILTLYILNPSSSSISVQIESENSTLPCSPVIVAPNSFGACSVDTSFEITTSSCKAIYVSSPFQCIYVQRQHYTSQDFSVIPILPVDTFRQSYRALSSVHDTEIIIVSLNSTSIDITPSGSSPVTIETERFETYSYQFGSGSDISGSSVISDNVVAIFQKETLANGYGLQQLLGEWSAGKTYVIPFVTGSTDTWKCLILKNSTDVSYSSSTLSRNAGNAVTGSVSSFMEISSTKPVLCQVYSGDTSISLFSFEQWSSSYSFVLKQNEISYKLLIVTTSADKDLLVLNINGILTIIVGTWVSVTKVTGSSLDLVALEMPIDLTGISDDVFVTLSHPNVNFQVVLLSTHSSSNRKTLTLVPGFNSVYSNVESCTKTLGYVGDLIDNDCDGIADEDLLKSSGANYADLKGIHQENTCFEKIRVNDCDVSPDPKFENSVQQRIIENGCVSGNKNDPFRPMSDFTYDSTKSDNITQIYRSGKVELVGFDGYDEIYLRCNVHFCFKYDSSCDTSCTKRRKRDVHSSNTVSDRLITLSDLQQITTSDESCFDSSAFISVISVLSIVFATLLCTILYFFVRLYQLTEIRRTQLPMSS
ncbi:uncharacterized protein LOC127732509 [Mytilus californianus]|uniref:uncharacterized protein LOC127732509 n=1 Tax=Mytilus californianus TaxID=6549 RepID=UPI002248360C|nr:uncharacterized protein LOC127732509 [Mytilus californianus]